MPQTLWAWPSDDALQKTPDEWLEKSPADLDQLDSAVAEYLKRPWLRHDTIDVSVINALIFTELAIFVEDMKTGRALGKPNWSYIFSGGNLFAQIGLSLMLPILGFFTAWIMWPAISAGFFAYGYETAALVTISVWALYVLPHYHSPVAVPRPQGSEDRGGESE